MKIRKDESKLIASLAVFRELYDSKKDVYSIIAEFLRNIILTNAKHQFNLTEITQILNSDFDFNLPEAVIETSIRKLDFIEKKDGFYNVTNYEELTDSGINEKQSKIEQNNSFIMNELFSFIETESKKILAPNEKQNVVNAFCSFLLDEEEFEKEEYLKYISAYVIKNKSNSDFLKQITTIKEGVVLYTGIKYTNDNTVFGIWDTSLTIFIDTEVLFNFAGYDGIVFQTQFKDFLSFVDEINKSQSQRIIKLKYFKDVTDEILRFFAKAEQIATGKEKLNPSRTAMASICNGCHTASDVVSKQTIFFELLKNNNIEEDDYQDYFSLENHKYNISDPISIDIIAKSLKRENISEHLRFLNFISIHRGDEIKNNFENIGFILLSGNTLTQKVGWHNEIKKNGSVPLVTNLRFLTTKFWFKLNKGFGENNYPNSFDIITKAQIVLSSQLNATVGIQFEVLQEKYKKEELSEDEAIATIANLRKQARKPEDIVENEISNVLDLISEDKIERYILEQEHFKNEALKEAQNNTELKKEINQKQSELDEYEKTQKALSSELLKTKKDTLKEKLNSIKIIENHKSSIDKKINFAFLLFKLRVLGVLILSYGIAYFLIWKYGWNDFEQWTWIVSVSIPLILSVTYLLFKEKALNPVELLRHQKYNIQIRKYKQFKIDINLLNQLSSEVEIMKNEIEKYVST